MIFSTKMSGVILGVLSGVLSGELLGAKNAIE